MKRFNKDFIFAKIIKLAPYFVLLLIFVFIWKINKLTPLWAGDYCRIGNSTSIFEAVQKAYNRYFTLNGRFFTNTINYLVFGNYPYSIKYFDLINSVFFCLLIFIIFSIAFDRKPKGLRDAVWILLIFNLIFVSTKGIGEVALWKTGSIGYLWGVTLELVVLLPFLSYIRSLKNPFSNRYRIWGFYLVSFIASTFIEHLSFAISAVTSYILLELRLRKEPIPNFLKLSTFLHIAGGLILLFSKGNFEKSLLQNVPSLSENIISNFNLLQTITQGALGWILLVFFVLALTDHIFIKNLKRSIIWLIFALASMTFLFFVFLPTEQPLIYRIAFPFEVFMILAITYLADFLPKISIFEITLSLILIVISLGYGMAAYKNSIFVHRQIVQRNELIDSLKARGEYSITVPGISLLGMDNSEREIISKYMYKSDLSQNPDSWINYCFAVANGLNQIVLPSVKDR